MREYIRRALLALTASAAALPVLLNALGGDFGERHAIMVAVAATAASILLAFKFGPIHALGAWFILCGAFYLERITEMGDVKRGGSYALLSGVMAGYLWPKAKRMSVALFIAAVAAQLKWEVEWPRLLLGVALGLVTSLVTDRIATDLTAPFRPGRRSVAYFFLLFTAGYVLAAIYFAQLYSVGMRMGQIPTLTMTETMYQSFVAQATGTLPSIVPSGWLIKLAYGAQCFFGPLWFAGYLGMILINLQRRREGTDENR